MNTTHQLPPRVHGYALALLGAGHGYRFEDDIVFLNAMFTVISAAAHERSWALQLWATPMAPTSDADLTGHLVAQAALPPIGEVADETRSYEVGAPALLPAGSAAYYMVMTLVSGNGQTFNELHDLVLLPQRQSFLHPRLAGAVGYRIEGDRVELNAGKIENPRHHGSLSGSLSLELWALASPYRGGSFRGAALAGVSFDPLAGQQTSPLRSFEVPFATPPAGSWHLVLMLREWTPTGFVTRDFTNFPGTFFQPRIELPPAPLLPVAPPTQIIEEPAIDATATMPRPKRQRTRRPTKPALPLGVNTASALKLATVKWLSTRVAKAIVAARPFDSLDDLLRVKGIGLKLLARISPGLKL
jgi:hypothetical protein